MRLDVDTRRLPTDPSLREHVAASLGFALSRYADEVKRVRVVLANAEGDVRCRLRARLLRAADPIVVEITDPCPRSAVKRAVDRLRRSVARRIEASRRLPARRPRA